MRASGSAAVGVVTEGVNVHTTLGVGVVAGDVPRDGGVSTLRGLLEGDGTGDLGVSTEDGNCVILLVSVMDAALEVHKDFDILICRARCPPSSRDQRHRI